MTGVGVIGILLSLAALPFFPPARRSQGFVLFLGLLIAHVGASIGYYFYALNSSSDAALYYYDTFGLRRGEFQLGTLFVIKLVQSMKAWLGGTYLDYFLIFQAFGFWGVLMLQRCFEAVEQTLGSFAARTPYWLLFLPGMHFWTGAIGKDAPLFLTISLAVWSVIRLSRRIPWFALAIVVMLLFRPHIAVLAMAALSGAAFFGRGLTPVAKVGLVVVAVTGLGFVASGAGPALGVDLASPAAVGSYLERQQQGASWVQGASGFQSAPFIFRLFSLLFRPLFFDANGAFGLIASAENLVFIYLIVFMVKNWRDGIALFRAELFLRFALFYALALTLLLTLTYYNVGLGVRQKMMTIPGFFTFFVAQWLFHRARVSGVYAVAAAPDMSESATVRVDAGLLAPAASVPTQKEP